MAKYDSIAALCDAGISYRHAVRLRKDSMILHRWHELECGDGNGCIERNEITGKPCWLNSFTGKRSPIADRETPALARIREIISHYPGFGFYVQGDPRGAALYILRPGDVPEGESPDSPDSYYSRGIVVCQ